MQVFNVVRKVLKYMLVLLSTPILSSYILQKSILIKVWIILFKDIHFFQ